MRCSIRGREVLSALAAARTPGRTCARVGDRVVDVPRPFPSPADWRDLWIYFILVDRFNHPRRRPRSTWDRVSGEYQGGSFGGIRDKLPYLQELGVGAIWLSPILKNPQYLPSSYHGYGAQDFLAIEPRLASDPARARADPRLVERELRELIDEAHARGIYIILDVVLNHAGDVFGYAEHGSVAPWSIETLPIAWRDADGVPNPEWTEAPDNPPIDGAVWPGEFRRNHCFLRQGDGAGTHGDYYGLKKLATDLRIEGVYPVRDALVQVYSYVIAKYDVDGFRIDTLGCVHPDFARVFGNAVREFALSIGKRNFFTFGEVVADDDEISRFIGRKGVEDGDLIGVDAALDFPLFFRLPHALKGFRAPADVVEMFSRRKRIYGGVLTPHGDPSPFLVTFLDNHDQVERFYHSPPSSPHWFDRQLILAIGVLFTLQGIPCLYYGTEQGLRSTRERYDEDGVLEHLRFEAVREALWGKEPLAFDRRHPFYVAIRSLSVVRAGQPPLRYGRQYFRPISGDGFHFGISRDAPGVMAYSRLLSDREVVVVANTSTRAGWSGQVIVDASLNPIGSPYQILFSNVDRAAPPRPVAHKPPGTLLIHDVGGAVTPGPARVLAVDLQPMEIQILARQRRGEWR